MYEFYNAQAPAAGSGGGGGYTHWKIWNFSRILNTLQIEKSFLACRNH